MTMAVRVKDQSLPILQSLGFLRKTLGDVGKVGHNDRILPAWRRRTDSLSNPRASLAARIGLHAVSGIPEFRISLRRAQLLEPDRLQRAIGGAAEDLADGYLQPS